MRRLWDFLARWIEVRRTQIALGFRVMTAALAALVVALALHLHLPLWAVLTAMIVTQMSVGRSLKATGDYLLGTVGGAVYGGVIAVLVPHDSELALLGVMALTVAPLAFVAAINPSFGVAPITAIIVLLLPSITHTNPIDSAVDRVLEVAVGALIGLVVSFAVVPARAHVLASDAAARLLDLLAGALDELLKGLTQGLDTETLHRLQDGIGDALVGVNAVSLEAERERAARLAAGPETGPLLRTLLRLRHDLVMIGRAAVVPLPAPLQARLAPVLAEIRGAAVRNLRESRVALLARSAPPELDGFEHALKVYSGQVAALRREGLTRGLSSDAAERFFALGFAIEQLHQNFIDLRRCVGSWSAVPAKPRRRARGATAR